MSPRTATPSDKKWLELLGGHRFEGVTLTQPQVDALAKFYDFEPIRPRAKEQAEDCDRKAQESYEARCAEIREENKTRRYQESMPQAPVSDVGALARLSETGDTVHVLRKTRDDGLRVMGFLSRYLTKGEDPVALVASLCIDAGFDVDPEVVEWVRELENAG